MLGKLIQVLHHQDIVLGKSYVLKEQTLEESGDYNTLNFYIQYSHTFSRLLKLST